MRTYYIDDERKFRCEIENGKFSGDLIFDMTNGSFYGNMPANMPKYTWFWYVMDFIKICELSLIGYLPIKCGNISLLSIGFLPVGCRNHRFILILRSYGKTFPRKRKVSSYSRRRYPSLIGIYLK